MRSGLIRHWGRRRRLGRDLAAPTARFGLAPREFQVKAGDGPWNIVEISKTLPITLRLAFGERPAVTFRGRLPPALCVFAQTAPSVTRAVINLDDEDLRRVPGNIAYCSNAAETILIPDPEFFASDGYRLWRDASPRQRPWRERSDTIVWRGSTTGYGTFPQGDFDAAGVLPRIRMCALLKAVAQTDARIANCVQVADPALHETRLRQAGLFGERRPPEAWRDDKFAIDIDGNSNAWSNLFTRLMFGCCVIKVASAQGYRQWYYDRLEPWQHFVPVRADLADLADTIAWCRSHESECANIAAAGQALALSMTAADEIADAVRRVEARLGA